MVIWPAFRMEKYRVYDHPDHAPKFTTSSDSSLKWLRKSKQCSHVSSRDFIFAIFGLISHDEPDDVVRISKF